MEKKGHICIGCEKLVDGICSVYNPEGMTYRNLMGYCPVVDKYADWREDKPKEVKTKVRVGQQKQKR